MESFMQQQKITRTLRALLRSKGVRYALVAQWLDLSESSVKRLFSQESLSITQIEVLTEKLGLSFLDVVALANPEDRLPEVLTEEQEQFLVDSPKLLRVFYLLFRHWRASDIARAWRMSQPELVRSLVALEKCSLIQLLPKNRVKLLVGPGLRWRANGPIAQFFRQDVSADFVAGCREKQKGEFLAFVPCELSVTASHRLMAKLKSVLREIQEVSELEAKSLKSETKGHGVLLAMRPWVHPLFVP
jgi:hypothetical protein